MPIWIIRGYFYGYAKWIELGHYCALRTRYKYRKTAQGYLAQVVLNDVASSILGNVKVVRHFLDVFSEELPGLPSGGDVEFNVELSPGTNFMLEIDS